MVDRGADIGQTIEIDRPNNLSQGVTTRFAEMKPPIIEDSSQIEQKRWQDFWEIFQTMYDMPNQPIDGNPRERDANAYAKATKIREIAEQRAGSRAAIELVTATDTITDTTTHNVLITYGDTISGPSTVYMVHHDTIKKADVPLSLSEDGERTFVQGPAVQDDTLPLTAALTGLDQIAVPENGAVIVVFTDHEENGCRGSSALLSELQKRISPDHPVALIAAESTNGELAIGHKGKFSADVDFSENSSTNPDDAYLFFYQNLKAVQSEVRRQNVGDDIVATTGLSTYGKASRTGENNQFTAKLDFRTGNKTKPDAVRTLWQTAFSTGLSDPTVTDINLIQEAQNLFSKGRFSFEVNNNKIAVKAHGDAPEHPSKHDLAGDHTVMPGLYLATWVAKLKGFQVDSVAWNSKSKQNSNPLEGEIVLQEGSAITIEELTEAVQGISGADIEAQAKKEDPIEEVNFKLVEALGASTDAVLSPFDDRRMTRIFEQLYPIQQNRRVIMPYMTDIGRIFNALFNDERRNKAKAPVYGFVKGQGDPNLLHKPNERVTLAQVTREIIEFPRLLKVIQDEFSQLI